MGLIFKKCTMCGCDHSGTFGDCCEGCKKNHPGESPLRAAFMEKNPPEPEKIKKRVKWGTVKPVEIS